MSDLTSRNKALMHRVYEEIWNQARVEVAAEVFDQPEGVKRFVSQFLISFPDLQHTIEEMIVEDHRIAVRFSALGTHLGPWMQFAATGKPIHYTGVTVAHIVEGRIIEHHTWWDKAGLIEQLK